MTADLADKATIVDHWESAVGSLDEFFGKIDKRHVIVDALDLMAHERPDAAAPFVIIAGV